MYLFLIYIFLYNCDDYQKSNNSTSNFNVELGGMIGGYPYFP